MFIVSHLSDEGYLVLEASSGEEAIAILRATNPPAISVVFTDIQLGGWVTGWDVADAFREAHPEIPLIYTSGGKFKTARGNCLEAPFFPSPTSLATLSSSSNAGLHD